jgi:hypothetical protein
MKVLPKNLLVSVAGGEADEVVFAYSGDSSGGGEMWGSDFGWDDSGDSVFGGGGSAIVSAGFDSQGVGMTSCVAMPPPPPPVADGLFGYTLSETLSGGTAAGGLAYGIGQGVGASLAIEAAGGLHGVGAMGAAATGVGSAMVLGFTASATAGYLAGTLLYHNSETVQDLSQAAVGGVLEVIETVKQAGAHVLGIERTPVPVYHP